MKKALTLVGLTALLLAAPVSAQFAGSGATTLTVNPTAEAAIQVNTATTALTSVGTTFNNFTGTTNITYKIRTTQSTGAGSITLQVTSDFSPAGGPSVATPPTAGDTLKYSCTVAAPGTACAGSPTASTSAQTSVATFGAGASSTAAGNAGSVSWTLTNDPVYKTGAYSATVTFTISAS